MTKNKKSEIKDLYNGEMSDGTYVNIWSDGDEENEWVFLCMGSISQGFPKEVFYELIDVLNNLKVKKIIKYQCNECEKMFDNQSDAEKCCPCKSEEEE